jgi:hypothetical protein
MCCRILGNTVAVWSKSGPEGRFPAQKHYCLTQSTPGYAQIWTGKGGLSIPSTLHEGQGLLTPGRSSNLDLRLINSPTRPVRVLNPPSRSKIEAETTVKEARSEAIRGPGADPRGPGYAYQADFPILSDTSTRRDSSVQKGHIIVQC